MHDITWWLFLLNPKRLEFIVQPNDHYHDDNLPLGYTIFGTFCYFRVQIQLINIFFFATTITVHDCNLEGFLCYLGGSLKKMKEGTLYSIFCQVPGAVCKDRLWCANHKCFHFIFFISIHECSSLEYDAKISKCLYKLELGTTNKAHHFLLFSLCITVCIQ